MKKIIALISILLAMSLTSYAQDARKYTTYVVKKGESLKKIAKKVGCKVREIKDLNPDIRRRPKVNTTLVVPNKNYTKKIILKKEERTTHTVEQGDGFYGIAKKYNVTIQSIKDANPQIDGDLKPGQTIKIPLRSDFSISTDKRKLNVYKVKKGDNKWNVSQKFGISVTELETLNPNHTGSLKVEDSIIVPEVKDKNIADYEEKSETKQDSSIIYHTVKKGEGLFRIAVIYNTTQEKIIELNPISTKKLRAGMLLRIPGKKKTKFLIHKVVKGDTFFSLTKTYGVTKEMLLELNKDLKLGLNQGMDLKIKTLPIIINKNYTPLEDVITTDKPLHLSILMPIMVKDSGATMSKADAQLQNICTDFYMGAEMAIDSLRKQGLQVTHHIYDTKNDLAELYAITKNDDFKQSDLIIGPFFFSKAIDLANRVSDIPVFTPIFSKKQCNDTHENLIKTAVNQKERINKLVLYLSENYTSQKIIIITDDKKENRTKGLEIGGLLQLHGSISNIDYIYPSHNKKNESHIYMDKKKLIKSIPQKGDTWVILISNEAIINADVANTYGVISKHKAVRLFTLNTFKKFDYLDFGHLSSLNWTFPSEQFEEFDSTSKKTFVTKYKKRNHSYPTPYSFTGFDLTYDLLIRLSSNETIEDGLNAGVSNRLAHQYKYYKTTNGDYKNKGVMMVSFSKEMTFKLIEERYPAEVKTIE